METQEVTLHNELKRKSIFLRDFTTELYASGATTIRIEKNLGRIAESWHTKADFSVLPTCIVLNPRRQDQFQHRLRPQRTELEDCGRGA